MRKYSIFSALVLSFTGCAIARSQPDPQTTPTAGDRVEVTNEIQAKPQVLNGFSRHDFVSSSEQLRGEALLQQEPSPDQMVQLLTDDHSRSDRIEELLKCAKNGDIVSLKLLGCADSDKDNLIIRIKKELLWDSRRPGYADLQMCLAKLGDATAYGEILSAYYSRNYALEESSIEALGYIESEKSLRILRDGLNDMSGPRYPFKSAESAGMNGPTTPPLRFSCLRVMNSLFPDSGIADDSSSWTDSDIKIFIIYYDRIHQGITP